MAADAEPEDGRSEARAIIASAAALVRELVEEGVTGFERLPALAPFEALTASPSAAPGRPFAAPNRTQSAPATAAPLTPARARPGTGHGGSTSLEAVRSELGDCRRCGLCEGRQKIVFGDGNPDAEILFVGEGPGEQEDRTGLPFVGRAGELLTQMIEKGMGIPRSAVYICNIVKCRPPGNRNPLPPEVSACRPFLDGQIAAIAPKVIVTLGKPAASLLLGREISITRVRGTWQTYRDIPLMPTLHPAYVLRQYTPENRRAVWQDLKAALERSRA
ncbi:MAG: uracil-DNA glycosylase [Myxococcota bacterium]